MLKKIIFMVLLTFAALTPIAMAAFPSDVTILNKNAIVKLTNDQLVDTYINTLAELQAEASFHTTSGYSVKEYVNYRNLLKFRYYLLMEIHSRNLEVPQFN